MGHVCPLPVKLLVDLLNSEYTVLYYLASWYIYRVISFHRERDAKGSRRAGSWTFETHEHMKLRFIKSHVRPRYNNVNKDEVNQCFTHIYLIMNAIRLKWLFPPGLIRGAYDMTSFGICQLFGRWFGDLNEKWTVFGILVTQQWRENTISDRNSDGI